MAGCWGAGLGAAVLFVQKGGRWIEEEEEEYELLVRG